MKDFPKAIAHNQISLDGAITGFPVDMGLYYKTVGSFQPEVYLVGSNTAKTGIEQFYPALPAEKADDFLPPESQAGDSRPWWVIPDTKGLLKGLLHVLRSSGFARDIAILISEHTPTDYVKYLQARHYRYACVGEDFADFPRAFGWMAHEFRCKTIVCDSGGILNNILLQQGLVDEISLLITPALVGSPHSRLYRTLDLKNNPVRLTLLTAPEQKGDLVWLRYQVLPPDNTPD